MSQVFFKGDVVFHPKYGKRTVKQTDVNCTMLEGVGWFENEVLSFTPWPAPNHERPFTEVGWWIRKSKSGEMDIRYRISKDEYRISPDPKWAPHYDLPSTEWIKFLGTEI